jgi:hypothetical protein
MHLSRGFLARSFDLIPKPNVPDVCHYRHSQGPALLRVADKSSRWMGIQERLYRVQVTINDGRWRAGVPIFGHPAPEMRTDSPAVLNRIKHLKSEAQLP